MGKCFRKRGERLQQAKIQPSKEAIKIIQDKLSLYMDAKRSLISTTVGMVSVG